MHKKSLDDAIELAIELMNLVSEQHGGFRIDLANGDSMKIADVMEQVGGLLGALEEESEEIMGRLRRTARRVMQLVKERDAAVKNVRRGCCTCKHLAKEIREAPCNSCRGNGQGGIKECWEWAGVEEEEHE